MQASADAVSDLARHGLMAMVEPFLSARVDGVVRNALTADAMVKAAGIAAGLGHDVRVHLAQAAGGRRDGAGLRGEHAARR